MTKEKVWAASKERDDFEKPENSEARVSSNDPPAEKSIFKKRWHPKDFNSTVWRTQQNHILGNWAAKFNRFFSVEKKINPHLPKPVGHSSPSGTPRIQKAYRYDPFSAERYFPKIRRAFCFIFMRSGLCGERRISNRMVETFPAVTMDTSKGESERMGVRKGEKERMVRKYLFLWNEIADKEIRFHFGDLRNVALPQTLGDFPPTSKQWRFSVWYSP